MNSKEDGDSMNNRIHDKGRLGTHVILPVSCPFPALDLSLLALEI
jgi:hypothetical protein